MASNLENGITTELSSHSFDQTVTKLEEVLRTKGIKLFALVDHCGEAERAGLKMPSTKLFTFGNPKAGTPAILAAPSIAIDLPLKILSWEDSRGRVRVSYNSPAYLQSGPAYQEELVRNITVVETLAAKACE
jgi:uncharacterized protein (DUF302 family)